MRVPWFCALLGITLALAGCGGTGKKAAPIRDINPATKAARAVKAKPRTSPGYHVVQPGETLYGIAFQSGLNYQDLAVWNGLDDPSLILVGSRLRLTPPDPPPSVQTVTYAPVTQDLTWVWPAKGQMVKGYDEDAGSKGIDIAAPRGTPVLAAAAGRVMYAGDGLRGYGKLIIIKHSDTLLSAYAHQDKILVAEGDRVAQGRQVGSMGDSDAEQVKLHFEIREYGKPVDPLRYLPK